jgi:hypothetical protein
MPYRIALAILFLLSLPITLLAQPVGTTHLADFTPTDGLYRRLLGSVGEGSSGVPVAGGFDMDKDGIRDYAMAAMRASPQGRSRAGQVFLVFGDNQAVGLVDTAMNDPKVLEIHGDQTQENTGSEIWMADVTGNGYGDLIICRQNYSPNGSRIGAGALTLIPANPVLRTMAAEGTVLDLRDPPGNLPILNIAGASTYSRLCIWARNGDVTGDGTDDLAIGADQEPSNGDEHAGAVYLIRGGLWLETADDIDLADFGTAAAGNIARIKPRTIGSDTDTGHYHFGATLQLADLDGNSKAEVIAAAALNRSGAGLAPSGPGGTTHASGGTSNGTVYIAWDDNFTGNWIPAPDFVIDSGSGSYSIINGGSNSGENPGPRNNAFGEEILGSLDYDNNDSIDLFVGDLTGDGYGSEIRSNAGLAHVIYDAENQLKGKEIELNSPPQGFTMATFLGPKSGAIAGDTALHGDFNDDGIADIAFSSPMDSPFGVINAGTLHIVLGKTGIWPVFSDLEPGNFPAPADVQIHEIYGGSGVGGSGGGDVLCYSAASGDMTNDGVIDLIVNEMQGDGSASEDAGNLLIIDSRILFNGQKLFNDGFEQ